MVERGSLDKRNQYAMMRAEVSRVPIHQCCQTVQRANNIIYKPRFALMPTNANTVSLHKTGVHEANAATSSVRKATVEEIEQLKRYLADEFMDEENTSAWVDGACIAVFPHYMTELPGYVGKVLVILYGGAPENVETYVWSGGQISRTI